LSPPDFRWIDTGTANLSSPIAAAAMATVGVAVTVLKETDKLPIRTGAPVHSGKVRSVYWLTAEDSARLVAERKYAVPADTALAVMVISDRISAFECVWRAEGGLDGVPGKGAALNAISNHWFTLFKQKGLADSHVLEVPHPLVWVVRRARPVLIEAICRQYITGSMWRAYSKGARNFCGIALADGLTKDQKLPELLVTPSTKGILVGIPDVPEQDDVNVSRADIDGSFAKFGFESAADVPVYETLLKDGFAAIAGALENLDQVFVDTKFEFGYVADGMGGEKLIYMDEVGTPDSSRIWDGPAYRESRVVEKSKEGFRQALLQHFPEPDIFTNKDRIEERYAIARDNELPRSFLMELSTTYVEMAERITGRKLVIPTNPEEEIINILRDEFKIIV